MLQFILLVILLFFTFATAASEISIIAVSRIKLKRLANSGSKRASIILKILETPEKFFSTILVANNLVNTLIASLATAVMISIIGDENNGIIAATIIVSVLVIVCEVIAKTLAAKKSEKLSLRFARPVNYLIIIFSPIVKFLAFITSSILKFVGVSDTGGKAFTTEEEIKAIMKIGEEEGVLHKEKYHLLSRVFDFSEAIVKNVMTPKANMVSIDVNSSLDDILDRVLEQGYSRIPVYRDNPDNIIGVINMKDLLTLSHNKGLFVLYDIIYPVTFVPISKKVTDLLKEFQKGHTHLAVALDEKNRIAGIITLEDLLEEIVGEIEDEYDIRTTKKPMNKEGDAGKSQK